MRICFAGGNTTLKVCVDSPTITKGAIKEQREKKNEKKNYIIGPGDAIKLAGVRFVRTGQQAAKVSKTPHSPGRKLGRDNAPGTQEYQTKL
jgi:hypothetical protein